MRSAFKHGAAIAPNWIRVIEAAKDWGVLPWEITSRYSAIVWYLRYIIYNNERLTVAKNLERERERQRRINRGRRS